jgi:hypothetical protein
LVDKIPGLSETQRRSVLGRNAIEWFGLKDDELPERSVWFDRPAPKDLVSTSEDSNGDG